MSNLRQAAHQALDALEFKGNIWHMDCPKDAAITALRAALAEDALQRLTDVQQEMEAHDPVDYRGWVLREVLFYNGEPVSHREPEQEPAVDCPRCGHCCPQQPAEPVAWMDREGDLYKMPEIKNWAPPHTMLYTAPPQRKPLTEEQVNECGMCGYVGKDKDKTGQCPKCRWDELRPLTGKAHQKPLTDDQIYEMYNEPRSDAEMLEFARAIEAAHGIKGEV